MKKIIKTGIVVGTVMLSAQIGNLAYAEENGSCMGKKVAADLLIHRQALHAHKICFPHPMTGKQMEFSVPMPKDMKNLMKI